MVEAPPLSLAALDGDVNAHTADLFRLFADDLEGDDAAECTAIGDCFLKKFKLTRLGKFFKLARHRAVETVAEAINDKTVGRSASEAWVESIEMQAGLSFADQSVPDSAALIGTSSNVLRTSGTKRERQPAPNREKTISEILAAAGTLKDEVIPLSSFAVLETQEPHLHEISEPEVEVWTDAVLEAYGERFLRFNLGKPLARHLGIDARGKIKLPAYGEKSAEQRTNSIGMMLYEKARNRKTVSDPRLRESRMRL